MADSRFHAVSGSGGGTWIPLRSAGMPIPSRDTLTNLLRRPISRDMSVPAGLLFSLTFVMCRLVRKICYNAEKLSSVLCYCLDRNRIRMEWVKPSLL